MTPEQLAEIQKLFEYDYGEISPADIEILLTSLKDMKTSSDSKIKSRIDRDVQLVKGIYQIPEPYSSNQSHMPLCPTCGARSDHYSFTEDDHICINGHTWKN